MKVKPKVVELDAHRWFKNGDHPADGPAHLEGKVVRYFRHPGFPGVMPCPTCKAMYHVHGWIDSGGDGWTVCPGDYIITGDGVRTTAAKPEDFQQNYDIVAGVAPGGLVQGPRAKSSPPAFIFFDTETNGLPKNYKAPLTDSANWPRLVQLAWLVYDEAGNHLWGASHIIKPEGWTVDPAASKIHRITHERAVAEGKPLGATLEAFYADAEGVMAVAHNVDFDKAIIGAERARVARIADAWPNPRTFYCTMKNTTNICKLPGRYGFKWPTLTELHKHLFGEGFAEAHDAMVDVQALAKCFWELRKRSEVLSI